MDCVAPFSSAATRRSGAGLGGGADATWASAQALMSSDEKISGSTDGANDHALRLWMSAHD